MKNADGFLISWHDGNIGIIEVEEYSSAHAVEACISDFSNTCVGAVQSIMAEY